MERIVAVIPARMGSSRFPGKPLAPLLGRPMIEHVVRRALMCSRLDAVYVATCDEEIRRAVEAFGGQVLMTSPAHERAGDRAAEAAERLWADIVVMIQGDEPLVTPDMIAAAVAPMLRDASVECVNLARRITVLEEYLDPNTIKVVMNADGDALYFSRSPIPAFDVTRGFDVEGAPAVFKQVCVIPFRRDFLREFTRLPPTPLERAESIDMLRVVEHGGRVRMVLTEADTHAVDTPEDLRLVEALLKDDPLVPLYAGGGEPPARGVEGARMRWRVLISAPYMLPVIDKYRPRLEAAGVEIVKARVLERLSEEELLPLVGEIDGAICGDDQFTGRVLRAAPRLKAISKWGTGVDSIDAGAAAELGIRILNTPGAFTDAVADTVMAYVLCFARRIPWMDAGVRRGLWTKPDAVSLSECTLGVVGVGNIGRAVVRRALAFGMTVIGNDPATLPASFLEETGITLLPLRALLEGADFVSLNCDLNPTSFHLIGSAELSFMRPGAYLVNTARGPVLDETALADALRERRLAGAALDVFEVEPLPLDSPLRALDNCLLAPHNANGSRAARSRVHESTISNLLVALWEAR